MSEQIQSDQATPTPDSAAPEQTNTADNTNHATQANTVVTKYMGWGAGAGVMPVPFWDVIAIGGVQVLMIKEIFAVYGVDYNEKKARSVVTLLLGSLSPGMLVGVTAATFMKLIPGVGSTLAAISLPLLASASTYAVGKVMIHHLEGGGSLHDFDAAKYKQKFNDSVEKGKELLKRKNVEAEPKASA